MFFELIILHELLKQRQFLPLFVYKTPLIFERISLGS